MMSYVFNMFFIDYFFIKHKKEELPLIVNKVESLLIDKKTKDLEKYLRDIKERRGITVYILDKNYKKWENYEGGFGSGFSVEDLVSNNFLIKNKRRTGARLLVYNLQAKNGRWISARVSITLLNSYKSDLLYFNIVGIILASIISLIIGRSWIKKILKDIEVLNKKAEDISNLKFNDDNIILRDDEIGDLGDKIEKMSHNLEKAIKQLESFVSNTSHELKTPVAIISSNAQLLIKEKNNDLIEERCKGILKESYYTKKMIEKLMTLSKVENSKEIKKEIVNINNILQEILERYDFIELSKNLDVNLNHLETEYYVDKDFFQIALDNIVLNSLKYSKENGSVEILEKNGKLEIINEIEKEFSVENIFSPFVRGENSSRKEGSGLGLTLVKKILDLNEIQYGIEIENKKFIFWIKK